MIDTIYSLLAHRWSGLAIAAFVAIVAWLLVRSGRRPGRRWARIVGFAVGLVAAFLTVGAAGAIRRVSTAFKKHPPLGRLVDVGGYRMHLLAEGEAKGGPTVVWIPGSHSAGITLFHLHQAIRDETRSILFDRPGSGWSDPGPFPRRTSREAEELATLLDRAGEPGPFVFVGHSYGGLLAANFARRYPAKTAALIIADGTPPDIFMYLPGGTGPGIPAGIVRGSQLAAAMKLFGLGLGSDPEHRTAGADTANSRLVRTINDRLAEVAGPLWAINTAPDWATPSIFREWLEPRSVADLVVYDRELGDLPVFLVVPAGKERPEAVRAIGVSAAETERALSFLEQSRIRYLRTSSRSELIHTPAGTGHNYPYETPEFLLEVVRLVLADSAVRSETRRPL